jgi:transposase
VAANSSRRARGQAIPGGSALLCAVAQAIARTCDNELAALSHRIARRRGKGRATLAVAHAVLVILSHLLRDQKPSTDLGVDSFDRLDTERIQRRSVQRRSVQRRSVQRLEQLGYSVILTPAPAA